MRDGLRRSHAIALMALVHIVAGFATAGITSDTQRSLHVAIGMFVVTGALLTVRLWRTTHMIRLPPIDPGA